MSNMKIVALIEARHGAERERIFADWQLAISEFWAKIEQLQERVKRLEDGRPPSLNG